MLEVLLERFRRGERAALARLLSLVARGEHLEEILSSLPRVVGAKLVVAFTGSGGVGKSTLIGKSIDQLRNDNQTVGVIACDPRSPLTGGALLGDRFRMPSRPQDDGVFIRSVAAEGGHGAVALHVDAMVRLLEAFGFDIIIVETAGAGQGDTAVHQLADVVAVLLQPETGDDIQWDKAGILEVADVVVINKADLASANVLEGQVRSALSLGTGPGMPVIKLSAKTGAGISDLWNAIIKMPKRRAAGLSNNCELLRLAQAALLVRFGAIENPALRQLLDDWQKGRVQKERALANLWHILADEQPDPFLDSSAIGDL